ncbi:MAG: hypothetical protein ACW99U_01625 [Candidatus Thorarchaeota archaeon]|jgi:hypothetical protein
MKQSETKSIVILLSMIVLSIFLPFGITTGMSGEGAINQRLVAPVWVLDLSGRVAGWFSFDLSWLRLTLLDFISQVIAAVMVALYYGGMIGRKPVILSGLIAPIVYMRVVLTAPDWVEWWMHYPIPLMLVIIIILLALFPLQRDHE